MQTIVPRWARIPTYVKAKDVVATNRGWEMKKSGELLVSFPKLADKLWKLKEEIDVSLRTVDKDHFSRRIKRNDAVNGKNTGDGSDSDDDKKSGSTKPESEEASKGKTTSRQDNENDGDVNAPPAKEDDVLEKLAEENDTEEDEDHVGAISKAPLSKEEVESEIMGALEEAGAKKEAENKPTAKKSPTKNKTRTRKKQG